MWWNWQYSGRVFSCQSLYFELCFIMVSSLTLYFVGIKSYECQTCDYLGCSAYLVITTLLHVVSESRSVTTNRLLTLIVTWSIGCWFEKWKNWNIHKPQVDPLDAHKNMTICLKGIFLYQ